MFQTPRSLALDIFSRPHGYLQPHVSERDKSPWNKTSMSRLHFEIWNKSSFIIGRFKKCRKIGVWWNKPSMMRLSMFNTLNCAKCMFEILPKNFYSLSFWFFSNFWKLVWIKFTYRTRLNRLLSIYSLFTFLGPDFEVFFQLHQRIQNLKLGQLSWSFSIIHFWEVGLFLRAW